MLRPLSEKEKAARARALTEAQKEEEEARRKAREETAKQAESDKKRKEEQEAAAARDADLKEERERQAKARADAALEATRRLEEGGAPPSLAPDPRAERPKTARRPERRRREGKLTIAKALDESERQVSLAALRRRRQRQRKAPESQAPAPPVARDVVIPETITVAELSARMARRAADVIRALMQQGVMAKASDILDADTAQLVAEELDHKVRRIAESDVEDALQSQPDKEENLRPRPPIVTVMGHVDHGKTSLLDALRQSAVAKGEKGGITQHVAAYRLRREGQSSASRRRDITFIDTPGHAAFTAMRARGAETTDIVVLVVAADDGVMPQTEEALAHAKAAGTPIVVAITKTDLAGADPEKVKQALAQKGLLAETMGGETLMVALSALKGEGLEALEEALLLQAELMDLKANPSRAARGVVLESGVRKGLGPVATFLVQNGTLRQGDLFVVGRHWGRVRALEDDRGKIVREAGPAEPCRVSGLSGVAEAGDHFDALDDESRAREIAEYRARKMRDLRALPGRQTPTSAEEMIASMKDSQEKPLFSAIFKTDVQGSAAALEEAARGVSEKAEFRLIHAGVGDVALSDVSLAQTTSAEIFGFNVRVAKDAQDAAKRMGVMIHTAPVIYDLLESMKNRIASRLEPAKREISLGKAKILKVFDLSRGRRAAGCRVEEGALQKAMRFRVSREGETVYEGALDSLRRFKEDAEEVRAGQECGLGFGAFQEMREGDWVECFRLEETPQEL